MRKIYIVSDLKYLRNKEKFDNKETEIVIPKSLNNSIWNFHGIPEANFQHPVFKEDWHKRIGKHENDIFSALSGDDSLKEKTLDNMAYCLAFYINNTNNHMYDYILKRDISVFLYKPGYGYSSEIKEFYYHGEEVPSSPFLGGNCWKAKRPLLYEEVSTVYNEVAKGSWKSSSQSTIITMEEFYNTIFSLTYPVQLIADYLRVLDSLNITLVGNEQIPDIIERLCYTEGWHCVTGKNPVYQINDKVNGVLSYNGGLVPTESIHFSI